MGKKIAKLVIAIVFFILLIVAYVIMICKEASLIWDSAILSFILVTLAVIIFDIVDLFTSKKNKNPYGFDYIKELKRYRKIVRGFEKKATNYREWKQLILNSFDERIKECNICFDNNEKEDLMHFWNVIQRNAVNKVKIIEIIMIPLSIMYTSIYFTLFKVEVGTVYSIIIVLVALVIIFTIELCNAYDEKYFADDVYEVLDTMQITDKDIKEDN